MKNNTPIAVTSRSFSKHPLLRKELLEKYNDVLFNDEGISFDKDSLIKFAQKRKKLITALEVIDEAVLSALPDLEVISKYGVGLDMLDKEAFIKYGIRLGWEGGVNKRSVSELTVSFMISILRHVMHCNLDIRDGNWINRKGKQLTGSTVGIVGCGHIGKDLVKILKPFNCKILVHDILNYSDFYEKYEVKSVELEELLRKSDIITLHLPLDNSTRNILNAERLLQMKLGAILINTARGGLVDEEALYERLYQGYLGGAAFDVFAVEPPQNFKLLSLKNFLATSHIGGSSEEAILAMGRSSINGLEKNSLPKPNAPLGT